MFDSRWELREAIRLGETTFLGLKEVRFAGGMVRGSDRRDLADELAAFANARGGVCVLGVNDRSREIVGIPDDRVGPVVALVREVCTDSVEPPLDPVIDSLRLPSGTGEEAAVVKVEIARSLFVHRSPGGRLHRVADSNRAMPREYLARLSRQRSRTGMIRFDQQVVHEAGLDALCSELWERFRTSLTGDDRDDLLSRLQMARRDQHGVLRPTVAGVLMASRDPREWLPNAFIQAVAYRGNRVRPRGWDTTYQMDASDISGPLDHQVAQACRFVTRNMKVLGLKDVGRVDRPQFDMTAVFEALVNVVAHRDYSIRGSKIRLRLFDDRLELSSPGSLMKSMTTENIVHLQSSRNNVVTSLLAKCPVSADIPWLETDRDTLMDRRGEGVRVILENSQRLAGREPEYRRIDDVELLLTIHAAQGTSKYRKDADPSRRHPMASAERVKALPRLHLTGPASTCRRF